MSTKKGFQLHTARNGEMTRWSTFIVLKRVILHKDLIYPVDFMTSLFFLKQSK